MLQQTRIEAVLPYYHRFTEALPDVHAVAAVSEEQLFKLWEGLGYYSRARNLQKTAVILVNEYGGCFPADYDRLLALPGIGPYTAGAIASIAYDIPVPAVDGNVMRVLSRLSGESANVLSAAGKKIFTDMAWELIPEQAPGRFNQALMELGETICVPNGAPHCEECPLRTVCEAYKTGRTDVLPVRSASKTRRMEQRTVAVARLNTQPPRVLLHKRPNSGLLAGLWELPNALSGHEDALFPFNADSNAWQELGEAKHIFSHIEWRMSGRLYDFDNLPPMTADYKTVTLDELHSLYAIPSAFRHYASQLESLLKKGELNDG